jgi:hypothetical protein
MDPKTVLGRGAEAACHLRPRENLATDGTVHAARCEPWDSFVGPRAPHYNTN